MIVALHHLRGCDLKQVLVEFHIEENLQNQIEEILKEHNSGKYRHILLHIYSGMEDARYTENLAHMLKEYLPKAEIVGTMSAGEIMGGHVIARGVLISATFFESTDVRVFRYDNVKGHESEVGRRICEQLDDIAEIQACEIILPGTELSTKAIYDEIDKCSGDISVFGGYSGGHEINAAIHYVFDDTGIMYDSIMVTTFSGKDFHINMDKVIGWEPLGVSFKVTKADGHRLIELDGRPASELYEKFLKIDRNLHDNAQAGYTFPLLAKYKGEQWLRSAIHIEEDGSLNMHGHVIEGMEIQLSYGNPRTIVTKVNSRLDEIRHFKPQVIWIYSCIVRKAFWERFVDLELDPFGKLCSTSGFYTWGEIIRTGDNKEIVEHNVTQVSIAMREGDAPDIDLPEVSVDDAVLRGPIAQMTRLSSLVYTTMEELQEAQNDLRILNEKLRSMAERDALTGLYNRGKTEEIIGRCLDEATSKDIPMSLIMIDIDHFKAVNDNFGHQIGDAVLKEEATVLRDIASAYQGGEAGRWGGEEFFIVLPGIAEKSVMDIAELLRKRTQEHDFPEVKHITISCGVITIQGEADTRDIFLQVDKALYIAKESGRNRVVKA